MPVPQHAPRVCGEHENPSNFTAQRRCAGQPARCAPPCSIQRKPPAPHLPFTLLITNRIPPLAPEAFKSRPAQFCCVPRPHSFSSMAREPGPSARGRHAEDSARPRAHLPLRSAPFPPRYSADATGSTQRCNGRDGQAMVLHLILPSSSSPPRSPACSLMWSRDSFSGATNRWEASQRPRCHPRSSTRAQRAQG